jgi:hypothetical protein
MFFDSEKRKNAAAAGLWKKPAMESEENQKQVSLTFHRPWKSRKTRGIPTFPTAPTAAGISHTRSGNLIVVDRKECLTPDTFTSEFLKKDWAFLSKLGRMSTLALDCVSLLVVGTGWLNDKTSQENGEPCPHLCR